MQYVRWKREGGVLVGYASSSVGMRRLFSIDRSKRGSKTVTYLRRLHDGDLRKCSTEVCKNVAHAREYASELARLANFNPL
jgi:hypothetical protein